MRTNKKILKLFGLVLACLLAAGAFFTSQQTQQQQVSTTETTQPAAQAPVAAANKQDPTAEEVRAEVAALLNELDSFRNTAIFEQCVYGCGSENPAKEWNLKRKALQDKMDPQLDVPILLKVAPSELHALGMAYAKGRGAEAKELRAGIEKALKQ